MSLSPPNDCNPKTTTLDATIERENLNCILKFGIPISIA